MRRRSAYGRRSRGVPWRWADSTVRTYEVGVVDNPAGFEAEQRSGIANSILNMPVRYDELPVVLTGHHTHEGVPLTFDALAGDPVVPTTLPTVPPERTLTRRCSDRVLSREEYVLYVKTWRIAMKDHPEWKGPQSRSSLHDFCIANVWLHRTATVLGKRCDGIASQAYHRAYLKLHRVRIRLGATRQQRLDRAFDDLATPSLSRIVVLADPIAENCA